MVLQTRQLYTAIVRALQVSGHIAASESAGLASHTLEANTLSRVAFRAAGATITFDWPYFWAGYLHDGRGPVSAKTATHLIFFRNPDDDPRIAGAARVYPQKKSDIRRLSSGEFKKWQAKNKQARKEGRPEPMVVRRNVKGFFGRHFLEVPASPMRDFERHGADAAAEEATRAFTELLAAETSFKARLDVSF